MIQIRDVPDDIHGILKARAAREGVSLSDYLKRELQRTAARPSIQEWLDRAQQAKPISANITPAQAVRELRESRAALSSAAKGREEALSGRSRQA
jgi:plasmid stability protein